MKWLVLGGTAWLGRELVQQAQAAGHEVACLARGQSGDWPQGVRVLRADRDAPDAYAEAAREHWDAVFDLTRQPIHARAAAAALSAAAARWVYVSSVSVYAHNGEPEADESAACVPPLTADRMASPADYAAAKRACECALEAALPAHRLWVVRPGLIGGPGDVSDRSGYWPLHFARALADAGPMWVPDAPSCRVQLVDVRDLAGWLVRGVQQARSGVHHALGASHTLESHLELALRVARDTLDLQEAVAPHSVHDPRVVRVSEDWLAQQGIAPWAGPRSLPLWVPGPAMRGFASRSDRAALAAGLQRRPLEDTLRDTLAWELSRTPGPRRAGMGRDEELALLGGLAL